MQAGSWSAIEGILDFGLNAFFVLVTLFVLEMGIAIIWLWGNNIKESFQMKGN